MSKIRTPGIHFALLSGEVFHHVVSSAFPDPFTASKPRLLPAGLDRADQGQSPFSGRWRFRPRILHRHLALYQGPRHFHAPATYPIGLETSGSGRVSSGAHLSPLAGEDL